MILFRGAHRRAIPPLVESRVIAVGTRKGPILTVQWYRTVLVCHNTKTAGRQSPPADRTGLAVQEADSSST
ncbi:hypothetical protein BH23PLA1_BH23PLA1_37500 [soil metagenome]